MLPLTPHSRAALLLLVSLTAAGPVAADSFGTDVSALSSYSYIDSDGVHPGANFNCDFVTPGSTNWCGPDLRQSDTGWSHSLGDAHLGMIAGDVDAANDPGNGRIRSSATLYANWWDTFTLQSNSLPDGTLITLQLRVDLSGDPVLPSVDSPAPYTRITAGMENGGPDAPAIVGATLYSTGEQSNVGTVQFAIGAPFTLFGTLFATTGVSDTPKGDHGQASGFAHYFIDVLTPDAQLVSASGTNYAYVPEPSTAISLGAGLMGLVAARRRRT